MISLLEVKLEATISEPSSISCRAKEGTQRTGVYTRGQGRACTLGELIEMFPDRGGGGHVDLFVSA